MMSGECDDCGRHAIECQCEKKSPCHEAEEGHRQLLNILNETYWFQPEGDDND